MWAISFHLDQSCAGVASFLLFPSRHRILRMLRRRILPSVNRRLEHLGKPRPLLRRYKLARCGERSGGLARLHTIWEHSRLSTTTRAKAGTADVDGSGLNLDFIIAKPYRQSLIGHHIHMDTSHYITQLHFTSAARMLSRLYYHTVIAWFP